MTNQQRWMMLTLLLCAAPMVTACDDSSPTANNLRDGDELPPDGESDAGVCEPQYAEVEHENPPAPEDIVVSYDANDATMLMLESWVPEATDVLGLTWIADDLVTFPQFDLPVLVVLVADDEQPILEHHNPETGLKLYKNAACLPRAKTAEEAAEEKCEQSAEPGMYRKTTYADPRHTCQVGSSWCVSETGLWSTTSFHSDKECKGPPLLGSNSYYTDVCNPFLH